jgi:hypothetical protein
MVGAHVVALQYGHVEEAGKCSRSQATQRAAQRRGTPAAVSKSPAAMGRGSVTVIC